MIAYYNRHPVWSLVVFLVAAFFVWAIFAAWPPGLEAVLGKKKVFLNAIFNGITLGGLYFLVASGFTLIFGLMKNVNLAHGSLYMLGGYIGYGVALATGFWLLSFVVAFVVVALVGIVLQYAVFRRMEGEDLRQTLVTIGISIVLADLMLWIMGGNTFQILAPEWLGGPVRLPLVTAVKSSGEPVYMTYPIVRLVIFLASVVIGGTLLTGGAGLVAGTFVGILIQGLIQTYIVFDGTLSSWWTKIAIGILLFLFIALQRGLAWFSDLRRIPKSGNRFSGKMRVETNS